MQPADSWSPHMQLSALACVQVLEGLAACHDTGIVHRDVKPQVHSQPVPLLHPAELPGCEGQAGQCNLTLQRHSAAHVGPGHLCIGRQDKTSLQQTPLAEVS